ncbi:MAG: phosphodiesterase YaeI [Akkermansia sp.]|nr:phosphodiesterase YaeI [Akkermansia sp.]
MKLKRHHIKRLLWLAAALVFLYYCTKWFGQWGAGQLECNTLELPAESLPGAGPLRIAFVSDVHNNRALFKEAVDMVELAKPDLIIYGGDFIMVSERFMRTRKPIEELRRLGSIAPTFAILGNQDYEKLEQVERVFKTAGIPLLRNQALDWTAPSGQEIRIIGLGDYNEGDEAPAQCMKPQGQEDKPVLLLSHDPESRWLLRQYDWDLMLSGHTHGGQLGIPFTEHYISLRSSMPAGSYAFEDNRRVIVTRGVGSIWGMRFFCPPEINIIDIKP